MRKLNLVVKLFGVLLACVIFSGCGLNITVKDPALSSINYTPQKETSSVTLNIVDARTGSDANFIMGKLGWGGKMQDISNILVLDNIKEPVGYLAVQLERELNSRGIAAKCILAQAGAEGLTLEINRYQIASYRASGFSPWESCHIFSGTINNNGQQTPIKAYFYNGKVPVWSMNEIVEPCFDIPTSVIIKEIASKINKAVFSLQAPEAKIEMLTSEINTDFEKDNTSQTFWKVLELGHTNNPAAMVPLKMYAQKGDEFFKSCALTAIGTLGSEDQFDFLKERFTAGGFNDRYMTVKAIGDINTPEALQFIEGLKNEEAYKGEGGLKSCVDLYAP